MKRTIVLIGALIWTGAARAASVGVLWDANTESDLAGYTVYCATYSLTGMTTAQALNAGTVTKQAAGTSITAATVSGLADATTYYLRLTAADASGNTSDWGFAPADPAVELSTCTPPPAPPLAPSNLAASAVYASSASITWKDNSANETGFKVERSTDNWASFVTLSTAANSTGYRDTTLLTCTTYYYRVRASNAAGDSTASNAVSFLTKDNLAPDAPTALDAPTVTSTTVTLTWTAPADNPNPGGSGVASYQIFRGAAQAGTSAAATFKVTGLSPLNAYTFTVKAVDAQGNVGPASVGVTTTTLDSIPAIPTGLHTTAVSSTSVSLAWTDASTNETGFKVERSADNWATVTLVDTTGPGATTDVDGTVLPSMAYKYRVRATNAVGDSNPSNVVSLTTPAPGSGDTSSPSTPGTPTVVSVTSTTVSLNWPDSTDDVGVSRYWVYRNAVLVGTAPTSDYQDTGLTSSTNYSYTVRALDAANNQSGLSPEVSTTTSDGTPPTTPGRPAAGTVTSTTIALSWAVSTDSGGSGLDKYWVWRDGVNVATVTAPTASDTDPGLTPSTAYSYQVSAWDKAGNQSALSAARSVTTSAAPDTTLPTAPPSLSTTTVSSTTVTLSWGDSTDAGGSGLAGYRVVRDGVFMTTATTTSFSDASVSPSRTYVYTVQAVDGAGNLSSATTKTVTTPAATVGGGSVGPSSVTMVETAAFPNPAVGKDPTIRAFVGDTDILEVTIYDASGSVVHSDRVTGGPTGTASDGRPYHDYVWTGKKASGVYFAVVHGKKGGDVIRGRTKFVVVR